MIKDPFGPAVKKDFTEEALRAAHQDAVERGAAWGSWEAYRAFSPFAYKGPYTPSAAVREAMRPQRAAVPKPRSSIGALAAVAGLIVAACAFTLGCGLILMAYAAMLGG